MAHRKGVVGGVDARRDCEHVSVSGAHSVPGSPRVYLANTSRMHPVDSPRNRRNSTHVPRGQHNTDTPTCRGRLPRTRTTSGASLHAGPTWPRHGVAGRAKAWQRRSKRSRGGAEAGQRRGRRVKAWQRRTHGHGTHGHGTHGHGTHGHGHASQTRDVYRL